MSTKQNASAAFHLLAKPTGAICNLDCKYCFFLSKEALYPGSKFRMSDELLDAYIRQLMEANASQEINIAWQGGEPTLMGLEFFERSVELANHYRKPGQSILHTMQTNGTLINDEWAEFFRKNNFLIGLSVDGPKEIHDKFRVNKGGGGSFDQVMRGWEHLIKHNVDFNILCTLHSENAEHPIELYRFFRDELQAKHIQFIPIIERATQDTLSVANEGWSEKPGGYRPLYVQHGSLVTERSIRSEQYGKFLTEIFKEWVRRDIGTVFVQMFDVTLASHFNMYSLCIHSPTCGGALAMEHNGDMYSCDHFVEPDYLLGNISEKPMIELVTSEKQEKFGQDKMDTLPKYCIECDVRYLCHGGCPKDRFISTPDGEPGLNYLCAGYKHFFRETEHPMKIMAELIRRGRYADEIRGIYDEQEKELEELFSKAERNDQCPCGSGKKMKHCHANLLPDVLEYVKKKDVNELIK
jgi:uncharacterized protein